MGQAMTHAESNAQRARAADQLVDAEAAKSAAARRSPEEDRFSANARKAKAEGWPRTSGPR